uniref:Uncharacterized protein n=1 Tax=Cucumis sativus TaxID=3659 RepID=A0A0A0KZW0_CUCSA
MGYALRLGLPFVPSYLGHVGAVEDMFQGVLELSSPGDPNVQNLYPAWDFNQFLAVTIRQEVKNLYYMNGRRIVVMGLTPIGCAPFYLWQYLGENAACTEEINDMVIKFNFFMRYMVEELSMELPDSNIIFSDLLRGLMDILKNHICALQGSMDLNRTSPCRTLR